MGSVRNRDSGEHQFLQLPHAGCDEFLIGQHVKFGVCLVDNTTEHLPLTTGAPV